MTCCLRCPLPLSRLSPCPEQSSRSGGDPGRSAATRVLLPSLVLSAPEQRRDDLPCLPQRSPGESDGTRWPTALCKLTLEKKVKKRHRKPSAVTRVHHPLPDASHPCTREDPPWPPREPGGDRGEFSGSSRSPTVRSGLHFTLVTKQRFESSRPVHAAGFVQTWECPPDAGQVAAAIVLRGEPHGGARRLPARSGAGEEEPGEGLGRLGLGADRLASRRPLAGF